MQIENFLIRRPSLEKLFNNLVDGGKTVYAPRVKGNVTLFAEADDFSGITDEYIVTSNTAKSIVFPKVEKVFSYKKSGKDLEITDAVYGNFPDVVVWGTRPCDAAAFIPLTGTFNNDYKDILYNKRMEKLYILSFSCSRCDDYCFCTSVNSGPGNIAGSDILFTTLSDGDYLAEVISEKGKIILDENKSLFESGPNEKKDLNLAVPTTRFNQEEVRSKLQILFENPVWDEKSMACLGCGSCAFVCPVCSCFDVQDETHGKNGVRLRCWDSCGFGLFTLHTSGHNPRETQGARWRQRILHKFLYMPNNSKLAGCVGCGRCSRSCPADINILDTVTSI